MNLRTDITYEMINHLNDKRNKMHVYYNTTVIETVINKNLAKQINRKEGFYYLVEFENFDKTSNVQMENVEKALSKVIKEILKKEKIDINNAKCLIVGLGNDNIIADSVGPSVVDKVIITRHLFNNCEYSTDLQKFNNVCALSPGVMGSTGIETSDIIKSIASNIDIDYIIVIDALSSSSIKRLNSSIQVTNTGISPGSGVNNKRKELSKEVFGIPVIALGVPTVVDAATISYNTLFKLLNHIQSNKKNKQLLNINETLNKDLINEVLYEENENMIVTSKDMEQDLQIISEVISNAINKALHNIFK